MSRADAASGRGNLLVEVRPHPGVRWLLTVFVVFLTVVVSLALIGLLHDVSRGRPQKQNDLTPVIVVPLIPIGFALLLAWAWRQRLRVHTEGVALRRLIGETWLDYRDVETVILTDPQGQFAPESGCAPWRLPSLLDGRGRGISFRGMSSTGFLSQGPVMSAMYRALHLALPHLGERTLQTLRAGEEVHFGKDVQVSWQGLRVRGRQLAWTDIHIDFGGKGLHVYVNNRPDASLELPGTTPNQHLLIWLAQRLPALSAIRAVTEFGSKVEKPTPATDAPVGPVYGFPDHDPVLGRLLCGQGLPMRKRWGTLGMFLWFAALALGQWVLPAVFLSGVVESFVWLLAPALVIVVVIPGKDRIGIASLFALVIFVGFVVGAAIINAPLSPVQYLGRVLPWIDLVLASIGLIGYVNARSEGFAIYENGIRGARRAVRWEESRHLTRNANLQMVTLQLEGTAGKVSFAGTDVAAQAAAQMVVTRAIPVLFQRTWATLAEGKEWRCGKVLVTREGMTNAGLTVPWEAVYSFKPDQGWLWVWIRGREQPFISLSLAQRDALVFLSLLEVIFRPQATGQPTGMERFEIPRDERFSTSRDNVAKLKEEPPLSEEL